MNNENQPNDTLPTIPGARVIAAIVVALLLWGAFHAVGAFGLNHNPWRGLVVFGFSLAFVLFWFALLVWRARRIESDRRR